MLDIEAESEQKCEDRIHLSCKQEEDRIPYGAVHRCPEFVLGLGEHEEVHLLLKMYQDYTCDSYSSQDICYIDTMVRFK